MPCCIGVHGGYRSCLCEEEHAEEDCWNRIGSAVHFSAEMCRLSV